MIGSPLTVCNKTKPYPFAFALAGFFGALAEEADAACDAEVADLSPEDDAGFVAEVLAEDADALLLEPDVT